MSEEKINKASAPKADNEGVYHLRLKQGDVPGYVILPGAPERALKIAKNWEDAKEIASYREYKTVVGKYKGMEMAATSTGIGGPSSEICIHELNTLGVHTCIRVGTTGCIVPDYSGCLLPQGRHLRNLHRTGIPGILQSVCCDGADPGL